MGWFIALAVMGFMLAPVLWMIPSPRQVRQEKIRQRARQLGLQVKITPMPQQHRAKVRGEDPVQGVCYTRPIHGRRNSPAWTQWLCEIEEREPSSPQPPLELANFIQAERAVLPADATLIERNQLGLCLYWFERNAELETIESLAAVLNRIVEFGNMEQKNGM
ncbi:MAG: hypothetical protein ACSHWQ_00715 [Spongiibacteraceae bacterium]